MEIYEIAITDITQYNNLYCVAGWDLHREAMIRPEPPASNVRYEASRFWEERYIGPSCFSVGNVVRFEASYPPGNFPFPHATEDCLVGLNVDVLVVKRLSLVELAQTVAKSVSPSLSQAFGGRLVRAPSGKAYVAAGEQTTSLDAVEILPNSISFHGDIPNGKLRAHIEQDGFLYDLAVTAVSARDRFLTDGIEALKADARDSERIHARIGLARPFAGQPNSCYAQVNGLYFL